ncbi:MULTISPECIES: hypothetical protein [unclassified Novosphingobium]|uniref:hypothetical protein n=1 Tax=unclassified Novosphingobium TaxID=2644732 RepID=UPI0025E53A68|nr:MULTISPECIES: hypothetical protein [unclassified Novosphingobium]
MSIYQALEAGFPKAVSRGLVAEIANSRDVGQGFGRCQKLLFTHARILADAFAILS